MMGCRRHDKKGIVCRRGLPYVCAHVQESRRPTNAHNNRKGGENYNHLHVFLVPPATFTGRAHVCCLSSLLRSPVMRLLFACITILSCARAFTLARRVPFLLRRMSSEKDIDGKFGAASALCCTSTLLPTLELSN